MRMIALSTGWVYVALALASVMPKRFFYTLAPFVAGVVAVLWTVYAIDHRSGKDAFYGAAWAAITVVATWTWTVNERTRRPVWRSDPYRSTWLPS